MRILGIDPAPGKGLSVFDPYRPDKGAIFYNVEARKAKEWFNELIESTNRRVILGWDAPLSADFSQTYTQRPIEQMLYKRWKGASVQGFSGCQHWTISIDIFGRPLPSDRVKEPDDRIPLLNEVQTRTAEFGVLETHPAVAMAVVWPKEETFPSYKNVNRSAKHSALQKIQDFLKSPAEQVFGAAWTELPQRVPGMEQDDLLDAQISFLEISACRYGRAIMLGDVFRGGFIVPKTQVSIELYDQYWNKPMNRIKIDELSPGEVVLSAERIDSYRKAFARGEQPAPVEIYYTEGKTIVRDGNNRVRAYIEHCTAKNDPVSTIAFMPSVAHRPTPACHDGLCRASLFYGRGANAFLNMPVGAGADYDDLQASVIQ